MITNREILGSASPLNLDSLRYLSQRWFSPQALTLGMPYPSCLNGKFCLSLNAVRLVPRKILPSPRVRTKTLGIEPHIFDCQGSASTY